jgi:hypothetical protein
MSLSWCLRRVTHRTVVERPTAGHSSPATGAPSEMGHSGLPYATERASFRRSRSAVPPHTPALSGSARA